MNPEAASDGDKASGPGEPGRYREPSRVRPRPTPDPDRRTHFQWRHLEKHETDMELLFALILPLSALLAWVMINLQLPFVRCNFRETTGIPCLTCGATRSVKSVILEFDLLTGFLYNPLVFLVLAGLGGIFVYSVIVKVFRLPRFRFALSRNHTRVLRWGLLVAVIVNWGYTLINPNV